MTDQTPSRRAVVRGAAAWGATVPIVAACGSTADESTSSGQPSPATTDGPITPAADVPVGGGVVLADQGYVVTQPERGQFRGFSSICTHQGCPVSNIDQGTIHCTCHGSRFSLDTGAPVQGPATDPLPEQPVINRSGSIVPDPGAR